MTLDLSKLQAQVDKTVDAETAAVVALKNGSGDQAAQQATVDGLVTKLADSASTLNAASGASAPVEPPA